MATGYLSTVGLILQAFTDQGVVLSGGKINTYVAGTSNPVTTYTDSTLSTPNANPIVLNSNGRLPASCWVPTGTVVKMVLTDSSGNTLSTIDNLPSVNDVSSGSLSEWSAGSTPSYVSSTTFTLSGDVRNTYQTSRRLRLTISGSYSYAIVVSQSYSASTQLTTITIDSSILTSGLTAVDYGIISVTNSSLPSVFNEYQGSDIASAATINLDAATGNLVDVTGSTTITGITLSQGRERTVRFTGALTLTNGSNLVLPGGVNITTGAGDYAIFRGYASGVVRCVVYQKITGSPVAPYSGSIIQALQAVKSDTFSTSATTYTVVTGLSQTVTPRNSSSKFLIIVNIAGSVNGDTESSLAIARNGTICTPTASAAGSRRTDTFPGVYSNSITVQIDSKTLCFLDSPATSSNITYAAMIRGSGGTIFVNSSYGDTDAATTNRVCSFITVMEVAG